MKQVKIMCICIICVYIHIIHTCIHMLQTFQARHSGLKCPAPFPSRCSLPARCRWPKSSTARSSRPCRSSKAPCGKYSNPSRGDQTIPRPGDRGADNGSCWAGRHWELKALREMVARQIKLLVLREFGLQGTASSKSPAAYRELP